MKSIFSGIIILLVLIAGCSQANKNLSKDVNSPIADSLISKGWNNIMGQNYEEAIEVFTALIEVEPRNIKAYTSRASAKEYKKDYVGAIADYSTAIEYGPNDTYIVNTYTDRGQMKYYINDYAGAIKDFSKAIDLDPYTAEAYWLRALVKYDLKDFRGSIADLSYYIERPNGNQANQVVAWYYKGIAKINIGQKEEGCLDLSKAGELGYSMAYDAINEYCNN